MVGFSFSAVISTRVGLIKHPTNTTDDIAFWKSAADLNTPADLTGRVGTLTHDTTKMCGEFGNTALATPYLLSNSDCAGTNLMVTCQVC